jgi:hypothetical protein
VEPYFKLLPLEGSELCPQTWQNLTWLRHSGRNGEAIQDPTAKNMHPIDIRQKMNVVYGQECADTSTVQCLAARVHDWKLEQVSLNPSDKQWSRRAWTATDKDHTGKVKNPTLKRSSSHRATSPATRQSSTTHPQVQEQLQRLNTLVSPSWITHNTALTWHHQTFISFPN